MNSTHPEVRIFGRKPVFQILRGFAMFISGTRAALAAP